MRDAKLVTPHRKEVDPYVYSQGMGAACSHRAPHIASGTNRDRGPPRVVDVGRRRPYVCRLPDVDERRLWTESRASTACEAFGYTADTWRKALGASAQGDTVQGRGLPGRTGLA